MTRYLGMYRRAELIRLTGVPTDSALQIAAERSQAAACESGQPQQETDSETGNEVCRSCGAVVDDYADVAAAEAARASEARPAMTTSSYPSAAEGGGVNA